MSKTVCMICLRSDFVRTEDIDDSLIEFYNELVYFDMFVHPDLNVCPICEHLLLKFYNFRQKCRRGLILLKTWSIAQNKINLQDLCTMLPRSPISICTTKSLQKLFIFHWSESKHVTNNNKPSLTECLPIVKPINQNPELKKLGTRVEKENCKPGLTKHWPIVKPINQNPELKKIGTRVEKENYRPGLTEDWPIVKPINQNPELKKIGTRVEKDTKLSNMENVKSFLDDFFKDNNLDNVKEVIPNNVDSENDATDNNSVADNVALKKEKVISNSIGKINKPKNKTCSKKTKIPKRMKKLLLKNALKALELSNPKEYQKKKEQMRKDAIDRSRVKFAERLKKNLLPRLEKGEFQDVEDLGVKMNKEVFLKVYEKCPLNTLAHYGVFKRVVATSKLRQFLLALLRKFNPIYETIMEVEYLDTHQKKVEEFKSLQYTKEYIEAHHRCEICFKVFEVQGLLDYHKKMWHDIQKPAMSVCDICSMRLRNSKLYNHMWNNHTFVYRCKLCPFTTHNFDNMKSHYLKHKGTSHRCPVCHKVFNCRSTMQNHRRSAHCTAYLCAFCANSFVSVLGLRQHITFKHSNESLEKLASKPTEQCTSCKAAFHSSQALLKHVARHHDGKRLAAVTQCFFCKELFETMEELQAHKLQTEHRGSRQRAAAVRPNGPFIECPVCHMQVANENKISLFLHYRKSHPNVKYESLTTACNYLCEQCGKAFKSLSVYRDHLNTHSGAKPYECSECGAAFPTRLQARVHLQRHAAPAYPCPHCPKLFPTHSSRYSHMQIHIGDRRFKCSICSKGFLFAGNLKKHIDGVHNQIRRVRSGNSKSQLKRINSIQDQIKVEDFTDQDQIKDEQHSLDGSQYNVTCEEMDVANEEVVSG